MTAQRLGGGLAGDVLAGDHSKFSELQITNKQRPDPCGIAPAPVTPSPL